MTICELVFAKNLVRNVPTEKILALEFSRVTRNRSDGDLDFARNNIHRVSSIQVDQDFRASLIKSCSQVIHLVQDVGHIAVRYLGVHLFGGFLGGFLRQIQHEFETFVETVRAERVTRNASVSVVLVIGQVQIRGSNILERYLIRKLLSSQEHCTPKDTTVVRAFVGNLLDVLGHTEPTVITTAKDRLDSLGQCFFHLGNVAGEVIGNFGVTHQFDDSSAKIHFTEAMNQEAANKILKILEEPWEKTLFILVSERPELLLQTIISRTQEVSVPRIDVATLREVAIAEGKSPEEALNMARLAGGSLLELGELMRGESDEMRHQCFELFTRLMRLSYNDKHLELFEWADDMTALTREGQRQFFLHSVRLLRESYMLHAGLGKISYLWGEEAEFCAKFAPFIGNQNIESLISEIERAMLQIAQNGAPRIVFTHFALAVSKMINRLQ